MTREEAITQYIMPALKRTWRDDTCIEIISAIEQDPCEDAIRRQAVLEIAKSSKSNWIDNSVLFKRVNELPPVNPQPKTGKWMETDSGDPYWYMCSECHRRLFEQEAYCPSCGAKMK